MEASVCRRSQWIRSFLGSSECCILLLLTQLSSKGHGAVRGWGGGRFPENTETSVQNQGARCWGQDNVPPSLFWGGAKWIKGSFRSVSPRGMSSLKIIHHVLTRSPPNSTWFHFIHSYTVTCDLSAKEKISCSSFQNNRRMQHRRTFMWCPEARCVWFHPEENTTWSGKESRGVCPVLGTPREGTDHCTSLHSSPLVKPSLGSLGSDAKVWQSGAIFSVGPVIWPLSWPG